MARVVHEHHDDSNGMGFVFGIVILIVLVLAFWMWGLPRLRQQTTTIEVNETESMPVIPSEIDVNITGIPQQQY